MSVTKAGVSPWRDMTPPPVAPIWKTRMEKKNMSVMGADVTRRPKVLAFAGPNGSGKSTLTRGLPVFETYVNADDLKREYSLTDPEAARQAEALRRLFPVCARIRRFPKNAYRKRPELPLGQ
ncbi:MAG: hypothetical protein LBK98_02730 [Peptococcaceae bacterium]|jgi:ABC-type polar amino acid transport system ATPase subunit|nr:hypothetical protein [Peptococcaceae bacterium]